MRAYKSKINHIQNETEIKKNVDYLLGPYFTSFLIKEY